MDGSGVFVDASSGNDSAAGTKEAPLKTIGAALAKTTTGNVYVCAGTYPEHVKITSPAKLFGGFSCGTWSYSTSSQAKVAPTDSGYALDVENVSTLVAVDDFEIDAIDGTSPSPSSVSVFVNASQLMMSRVRVNAGRGANGADGKSSATTILSPAASGNSPNGGTGGAARTCTCSDGQTVGGAGGSKAVGQTNGSAGTPSVGGVAPKDGEGGTGGNATCTSVGAGGTGGDGADGDAGANGSSAEVFGTLDATGFHPANGSDGAAGSRAQGGGGGGTTAASTNGGGGGGCGGCGGTFGRGGQGGGASITIVSLNSNVTLRACTLFAQDTGNGGSGGDGQLGALGGSSGTDPLAMSCAGGHGGSGGTGGAGGGGAGGVSVGILQKGPAPDVDQGTNIGESGGGRGGFAGKGGTGTGIVGAPRDVLVVD